MRLQGLEQPYAICRPSQSDIDELLRWLEAEYISTGEGHWSNRDLIQEAYVEQQLTVITHADAVVGFAAGRFGLDLISVKSANQRRGIGRMLVEYLINRARDQDIPVLRVQCAPSSSLPFWERMGFELYGQATNDEKSPLVRMILAKDLQLPVHGTPAHAEIAYLSELALHQPIARHRPITCYRPPALIANDGVIHLGQRCIGPDLIDTANDLVLRITIDGKLLYLDKAKYPEAKALGVRIHCVTGDYYLDRVVLPPQT